MWIETEQDFVLPYVELLRRGRMSAPRGMKTMEIEDFHYSISPRVRFNTHKARGLRLPYIKQEMMWYLRADRSDLSICGHAKMWEKSVRDGLINSCYGHYWFRRNSGIISVMETLTLDPDSRRAVIPMIGTEYEHFGPGVADLPCTTSVEFRIRDSRLNARFVMRSQDAVFGMGNDIPTFSFLQELVATGLGVEMGTLSVSVGSFHAYERHFGVIDKLAVVDPSMVVPTVPDMTMSDVNAAVLCEVPAGTDWGDWLKS